MILVSNLYLTKYHIVFYDKELPNHRVAKHHQQQT